MTKQNLPAHGIMHENVKDGLGPQPEGLSGRSNMFVCNTKGGEDG